MKRSWPGTSTMPRRKGGRSRRGEADVDGDAAGLFFGQAVAVDAGEGLDERGLAVVDVAGGAEDQVACHESASLALASHLSIVTMSHAVEMHHETAMRLAYRRRG